MMDGVWEVSLHKEVEAWFLELCRDDPISAMLIEEAIVLVGGDKAGNWQSWYRTAIPIADRRYGEHLDALDEEN